MLITTSLSQKIVTMSSEPNKSRFTLNQKLMIITAVLIISIVSSPLVYAVVEPHIKITMGESQTTKPFQIVNNLDQEVFSVGADGTIFPELELPTTITSFTTILPEVTVREDRSRIDMNRIAISIHVVGEITKDTTGDVPNISGFDTGAYADQIHFATWRIDFASFDECPTCNGNSSPRSQPLVAHYTWESNTKSDNGATRSDGITLWIWSDDEPLKNVWRIYGGDNDPVYESDHLGTFFETDMCNLDRGQITGANDSCFIDFSWGVGSNGADTTIYMKNSFVYYDIILPEGATITKVL